MAIVATGQLDYRSSKRTEVLFISGAQYGKRGPITLKPTKGRAIRITSLAAASSLLGGFVLSGSDRGNIAPTATLSNTTSSSSNAFTVGAVTPAGASRNPSTGNVPVIEFGIDEVVTMTWTNASSELDYAYEEIQ